MNREQLFESVMKEFQNRAIDVLEEVAGKVVVEYLPHVETDTEFNATHIAEGFMRDFLSEKRTWRTENFVTHIHASDVRKAIFEQYRSELELGIIKDLQAEVESLKISLENAYRRW